MRGAPLAALRGPLSLRLAFVSFALSLFLPSSPFLSLLPFSLFLSHSRYHSFSFFVDHVNETPLQQERVKDPREEERKKKNIPTRADCIYGRVSGGRVQRARTRIQVLTAV